ncbi:MAG: alanyl-tRNA editing protein [Lachnospiraceae bacterium]|nr:alanyl-tRNA editing protein [Lachnospiraceae bacterium]
MSKLYETDSYIKEVTTSVTGSYTDDKGRHCVTFEDTIFFPEEGGQNADTGIVIPAYDDGTYDEDAAIKLLGGAVLGGSPVYFLSDEIKEGSSVICRLDWDMRYDRMQNHTGEHILTGVIHNAFGFDNVGFHLSDTGFVTLDLNGTLSYEKVIEMEEEANKVIYLNLPVKDSYPSRDELKNIDYRSKIEIEGQVRLITVGDDKTRVDVCACCAPHVARTGEVGIIKVISVINWKGGIRISILCGRRALLYINKEHDILKKVAESLSTDIVNVPELVDSYRFQVADLNAGLANEKALRVIDKVIADDKIKCVFGEPGLPPEAMKDIYNVLKEKRQGRIGVFAGSDDEGYRFNAGGDDPLALLSELKDKLGAKGGGSPEMIQGRINAGRKEIERLFYE